MASSNVTSIVNDFGAHPEKTLFDERAKDWQDIIPLPAIRTEPLSMRSQHLPSALRNWIECASSRLGCPIEAFAAVAVASTAIVLGSKIFVQPKEHDTDWKVSCSCLWTMLVGSPGTKKSHIQSAALEPLHHLEIASRQEFDLHESNNRTVREAIDLRIDGLKKQLINRKFRKDDDECFEEFQRKLSELENQKENLTKFLRRRKINDCTVEKAGAILRENPNGIGVIVDELAPWIKSLEKPGQEGSRGFYLSAHNGANDYTFDRIGRGTIYIPKLFVTVIGGIQPGPLSKLMGKGSNNNDEADGLLQRFQLFVYLSQNRFKSGLDKIPDALAYSRVTKIFELLDSLDFVQRQSSTTAERLTFDSQAQSLFSQWLLSFEGKLHATIFSSSYESYLCKNPSTIIALASIFQLIEDADFFVKSGYKKPSNALQISSASFLLAREWLEIYESHAEHFYASINQSKLMSANVLLSKFREGKLTDGVSVREIYRHGWSFLKADEAKEALNILADHRYLRIEMKETGSRPSSIVVLNPSLKFSDHKL